MARKRQRDQATMAKIIATVIAVIVLIVLVIFLINLIVTRGAALLRDAGEAPIEATVAPEEEFWVPDVDTGLEEGLNDEQSTTPQFTPNVEDSADFKSFDGGIEDSVPVDALPEELASATPDPTVAPQPDPSEAPVE